MRRVFAACALLAVSPAALAELPDACGQPTLHVQILGSGGANDVPGRAAGGTLLWMGGKARALIDFGDGAAMRFAAVGARAADLDVVLFTGLQTHQTGDLAALVAAARREERTRPLPLYGPGGNRFAPSTVTFVRTLLDGTRGAYRYLGDVLSPLVREGYRLEPHDVRERTRKLGGRPDDENSVRDVHANERFRADAVALTHGRFPALAWRIRSGTRTLVFTAPFAAPNDALAQLASGADVFLVPLPPGLAQRASEARATAYASIGRLAASAGVKRLVLTGADPAALEQGEEMRRALRAVYSGPVVFAADLDCFAPHAAVPGSSAGDAM